MGIIWWHNCLSFFCYYDLFPKKRFQISATFCSYVEKKKTIGKALSVWWVYVSLLWQKLLIRNLGHLLWALLTMKELASLMRNDANSFIVCRAHKRWPRLGINSFCQTKETHTQSHTQCFSNGLLFFYIAAKFPTFGRYLNFLLKRNHNNRKMKDSYDTKLNP